MRPARTLTLSMIAVLPVVFVMLPLAMMRPAQPPEIPEGVVLEAAPVGAVALPEAAFEPLYNIDSGGYIDPHTGLPKLSTYIGVDGERITVPRVRAFLDRYGSPMGPYAREVVAAGVRYGVDPRLIVAIAGTESTFGKFHRGHNAWGWDAPNGLTRWPDWPTAIAEYARLFTSGYRSGDPAVIGPRYCPDCERWPFTTRLFFSMV